MRGGCSILNLNGRILARIAIHILASIPLMGHLLNLTGTWRPQLAKGKVGWGKQPTSIHKAEVRRNADSCSHPDIMAR